MSAPVDPRLDADPFRRRVVMALVGVASASFVAAMAFAIFGDEWFAPGEAANDSYSHSALGHAALIALLEESDRYVLRRRTNGSADYDATLVMAEPDPDLLDTLSGKFTSEPALRARIDEAGVSEVVVALPKLYGESAPGKGDVVSSVGSWPEARVSEVLEALGLGGVTIVRVDEVADWASVSDEIEVTGRPTLEYPQLLEPGLALDPLVTVTDGDGQRRVLVGQAWLGNTRLRLISDPDLLNNLGLWQPGHAELMLQLLSSAPGAVLIDEAIHGHRARRSLWRALFDFPLVLVVLHTLLLMGLVLWATRRRFGDPDPEAPAHPVTGRQALIDNTADLLLAAGHARYALEAYWFSTVRGLAQRLNGPLEAGDPGDRARLEWLSRVAQHRGLDLNPKALARAVDELSVEGPGGARRVVLLARRIHDLQSQLLNR